MVRAHESAPSPNRGRLDEFEKDCVEFGRMEGCADIWVESVALCS